MGILILTNRSLGANGGDNVNQTLIVVDVNEEQCVEALHLSAPDFASLHTFAFFPFTFFMHLFFLFSKANENSAALWNELDSTLIVLL